MRIKTLSWLSLAVLPVLWLLFSARAEMPLLGSFYIPVHTIMEVFSVVVSAMVFAIGWHSFDQKTQTGVTALSVGFLVVALLDIGHLLSVPGMPVFVTPNSVEKGLEFWLVARIVSAVTILLVALIPITHLCRASVRYTVLMLALGLVALIYGVILFTPLAVPDAYVEGLGLTKQEILVEYVIIVMYLGASFLLLLRGHEAFPQRKGYLALAAGLLALGEVCLTLYGRADDVANLLGHVYKVAACLCLYRAIFVSGISEPYQALRHSQEQLRQSEGKFRGIMEFAPDAIFLVDGDGKMRAVNARAEALFKLTRARALETSINLYIPSWPTLNSDGDVLCRTSDGQIFHAEINKGSLESDGHPLMVAVVRDVTERRRLEAALMERLSRDALTGLPNRSLVLGKLRESLLRARLGGHMVAVLFLDLDFFKKVNDTFGHAHGDEVLHETVRRIESVLERVDLFARQGGDEFIVVQRTVSRVADVSKLAESLIAAMGEPFDIQGHQVFLGVSIGIALYHNDEAGEEELLQRAHLALTNVKAESRNSYRYYEPHMEQGLREKVALEGLLRHAMTDRQLYLLYQPRVCLHTGDLIGVEALLRWQHPTLGLVPPSRFIPIAEESGLIEAIGAWVLQEACTQAETWHQMGLESLRVAVNLSPRQFHYVNLLSQVKDVLSSTGIAPHLLELEITEGAVMKDTESAIDTLHQLKKLGVILSVDDFGTGYSSLSYLKLFPIDVLKIDQSFIRDMMASGSDSAIVKAIVALGQSLRLTVVAEGVETREQATALIAMGCDEIQGYYFCRPVSPEAIADIARKQSGGGAQRWLGELVEASAHESVVHSDT